MSKDSILLIRNMVRSYNAARLSSLEAYGDLNMVVLFSAKERSERQFRDLLSPVGLKVGFRQSVLLGVVKCD
ncbi:hypothetical protein ASPWEDRAFT_35333 [Aspergillus wentii DTO 134E9]|uniref:Uncharacterized protein n=1 Tax=Aspergillus wentii DTO 134E9 TaxID=1073089 RepID=A0A1L9S3J1_ASPWE|nr:uncharacterized protein ASPWEDRAFT_35333 [Aspergillus wentii DTO 134E9]OJJ41730.1 hypothetical protein ASPWEDRAFT_35333 [Aspergillus wentii DTO 134E9]